MPWGSHTVASCFKAPETDVVIEECVEDTDCIRTATDAGCHGSWQTAKVTNHLFAGLIANYRVEIANHLWERMWAGNRTE